MHTCVGKGEEKYKSTFNHWLSKDSKITADGDCSHEIKRCLLLGRKVMTNLDSILKSRDITLPTKVRLVKAMVFPVVMYECESWTMKKAECQRIDAFELVLKKTLESPFNCMNRRAWCAAKSWDQKESDTTERLN